MSKNNKNISKFYCYILRSLNDNHKNKTYNGSTNCIKRRLRQHNGEICGGAKATRGKGQWVPYVIMEGFETHSEALSAEWRIKKPTNSKKRPGQYNGVKGRVKSLNILIGLDNWTSKSSGLSSGREYILYIEEEYLELIDMSLKKDNITIKNLNELNYNTMELYKPKS